MTACATCEQELDPTWKYCIHCGAAVASPMIPAAIRPDDEAKLKSPVHLSTRTLFVGGVIFFAAGIALVVVAILVYSSQLL